MHALTLTASTFLAMQACRRLMPAIPLAFDLEAKTVNHSKKTPAEMPGLTRYLLCQASLAARAHHSNNKGGHWPTLSVSGLHRQIER